VDEKKKGSLWGRIGGFLLVLFIATVIIALGIMYVQTSVRNGANKANVVCPACGARLEIDLKEKKP